MIMFVWLVALGHLERDVYPGIETLSVGLGEILLGLEDDLVHLPGRQLCPFEVVVAIGPELRAASISVGNTFREGLEVGGAAIGGHHLQFDRYTGGRLAYRRVQHCAGNVSYCDKDEAVICFDLSYKSRLYMIA